MLWKGRRQSSNVEDTRGRSGGGFPGGLPGGGGPGRVRIPIGRGTGSGMSISTIIILVVLFFALRACGIDPLEMLNGGGVPGGGGQISETTDSGTGSPASDEMTQFVSTVLAETEDVWNGIFQAEGLKYTEPTLLLFARLAGERVIPDRRLWPAVLAAGITGNALPFALISWGEEHIDSGLAAILMGVMPLATVIIAHFVTSDEKLDLRKIVGVLLGPAREGKFCLVRVECAGDQLALAII